MNTQGTLKPGQTLQGGKYLITEVLGQGLFGITYLAMQVQLSEKVIVKEFFLRDHHIRNDDLSLACEDIDPHVIEHFRKEYFKEAKMLSRCNDNKHIVSVRDTFDENATVYIVTSYIFEDDLRTLIQDTPGHRLAEDRAIEIILQVAEGLKALHHHELCHLDLAPGKIVLTKKGEAIIIDPGLAIHRIPKEILPAQEMLLKPGYSAPERYTADGEVGPFTDVYALGGILYYLLTGQNPPTAEELKSESMAVRLKRISSLSASVIAAISGAMELERESRLQKISDFTSILLGHSGSSSRKSKKRFILITAIFVVLVVSTILILKFGNFTKTDVNDQKIKVSGLDAIRDMQRGTVIIPLPGSEDTLNAGTYYALLIGVEEYIKESPWDPLEKPIDDAERMRDLLVEEYTFDSANVKLLSDPTEADMLAAFSYYIPRLKENDNLLVFYAGHGYYDREEQRGYMIPVDGKDKASYVPFSTVRDIFANIKARHILFITDACQSGSIFLNRGVNDIPIDSLDNMTITQFRERSVNAFTSANFNSVPDESEFIRALISTLEENRQRVILGFDIYINTREKLRGSKNDPARWGELDDCGSRGGDFLFIRRK